LRDSNPGGGFRESVLNGHFGWNSSGISRSFQDEPAEARKSARMSHTIRILLPQPCRTTIRGIASDDGSYFSQGRSV